MKDNKECPRCGAHGCFIICSVCSYKRPPVKYSYVPLAPIEHQPPGPFCTVNREGIWPFSDGEIESNNKRSNSK